MITVKYDTTPPLGHPKITLSLFHKDILKHSVSCLVDSGADCTTLPSSMSPLIYGFDVCKMPESFLKRLGAVLNESECFCGDKINSVKLPLMVGFDKFTFPININWVDNANAMPLLGREDFFDCFKIELDGLRQQVIFYPNLEHIEKQKSKFDFNKINNLIARLKIV